MISFYQWRGNDLFLRIKVQPNASKDELSEILGDCLKVRIIAPPVDGKANKHLIAYLAKTFNVSKSNVTLISGETGREKRIKIQSPKVLPDIIQA
jgi:uncharacterized protein